MSLQPGHYRTLSNDDYHADPSISKSKLDVIGHHFAGGEIIPTGSPAHFYDKYLSPNPEPDEPTEAKILGQAFHVAVLEPDLFPQQYTVLTEKIDRRTTAGKAAWAAWQKDNGDKTLLTQDQWAVVVGQRDAIFRCKEAWSLIENADREQSYVAADPETGLLVRTRPDAFDRTSGVMTDLKRTLKSSSAAFGKAAETYRYHVQGGWYPLVVNLTTRETVQEFRFVCVEPERPFAVGIYYLTEPDFKEGLELARADMRVIAECQQSGRWPDWAGVAGVQPLQRPRWAKRKENA